MVLSQQRSASSGLSHRLCGKHAWCSIGNCEAVQAVHPHGYAKGLSHILIWATLLWLFSQEEISVNGRNKGLEFPGDLL